MLSGKTYRGRYYIDATYEGDLMAAAGVSYHVGRESNAQYGETWNGVQTGVFHHHHYFKNRIDPFVEKGNPSSGLLPGVSPVAPGDYGAGDHRVQAYCFRMCLTRHPDNRVPFAKPEEYDPAEYELLARMLRKTGLRVSGGWKPFGKFDPIPNLKTDTNNRGPFSTDYIGMNYDYPEASYEERRKIVEKHMNYTQGYFYFMSHDSSVPERVREEMQQWGLAKDEFADNGNWPYQIYVREARRMVGDFVMTEHEVLSRREVPRPVGMGSYPLDSHNVQRYVTPEGYVQNEGDVGVNPPRPYSIAYGALLPKAAECSNLVVPVALSSSHIAFGSMRMEPVFMILGQSAATAAGLALDEGSSLHALPYPMLRQRLEDDGQVLARK